MHKPSFKKIMGLGIILLFMLSTCTPLSGTTINDSTSEATIPPPSTPVKSQDAVVTCSTYGIGNKDTERKATITQSEANQLLAKITLYADIIAQAPQSPEATHLQEEILNLALEYGLIPKDTAAQIKTMQFPKTRLLPKTPASPMSKADEWFCNYAAAGEGASTPVIILPRLIPILLTPIPRIFYRWNCRIGYSSVGGMRSGTGFYATGEQTGRALGFWGIGFSIFLPPVMAFGIFGYALYCSVEAEHIEFWPPNYQPDINPVYPLDGAINIPLSTSELSFYIDDYENELMSYSVITDPDIGTGNGNLKPDGTYTIPISGLEGSETYTWTVTVSDGPNTVDETYSFTTEQVAPIISNPYPDDGGYLIPVDTPELRFHLQDLQGDLMDYTVETVPDIGSGGDTSVGNGIYSIPINNLEYLTNYKWYVNVTDGVHWKHKEFNFQTEMIMTFNPFNEGWQYRKNITIDHAQVSGDLQHFPVLISLTDTDLRDKAQPDGDDILFMDAIGFATRLFHETEYYDENNGELVAWVTLPNLNPTTDTQLCLYYGNPSCDDQQFPYYVWDENYEAVWHMTTEQDSTANHHDLTNYGATPGTLGQIHHSYSFDGIDDYMKFPPVIASGKPLTMDLWVTIKNTNAENGPVQGLFTPYKEKVTHITFRRIEHPNIPPMCIYTDFYTGTNHLVDTGANTISYGTMYHIASTLDNTGVGKIYMNGDLKETTTGIGSLDTFSGRDNIIGAYSHPAGPTDFSNSYIDEIRVSQYARSPEWIQTQYTNQNNPSMFYIVGPEETGP